MHVRKIRGPELAKKAGVSVPYIYDLINARADNPSRDKMKALSTALGVKEGWLLTGEGLSGVDDVANDRNILMDEGVEYQASQLPPSVRIALSATADACSREGARAVRERSGGL